jgi:hypothetical protein
MGRTRSSWSVHASRKPPKKLPIDFFNTIGRNQKFDKCTVGVDYVATNGSARAIFSLSVSLIFHQLGAVFTFCVIRHGGRRNEGEQGEDQERNRIQDTGTQAIKTSGLLDLRKNGTEARDWRTQVGADKDDAEVEAETVAGSLL